MHRLSARISVRTIFVVLCLWVIVTISPPSCSQSTKRSKGQVVTDTSLARPFPWGVTVLRLFSDSPKIVFTLTTSWIPGENHKGMLRYKTSAFVFTDTPPNAARDPEQAATEEKVLQRVHACAIFLELYDADGFKLREIHVPLTMAVDDQARLQSLEANDSVQMDAREYRQFLGSVKASGTWNVKWACAA
jgi:hypothetical protein